MILRCSIGLCILFHLILLCQGQRDVHRNGHGSDGIGFGYPESEEEDPGKQNALVSANSFQLIVCVFFFSSHLFVSSQRVNRGSLQS